MADPSLPTATIRELLEHDAFLRTLARSLLVDEARADDLVQEAYVAVLKRPPGRPGPLTGWLAAIVRHLAWKSRRGEARRIQHEQQATAPDPVPSAATVLAREEARRHVVKAVLELEEPYRSTVLLRHFEQMSPGAIAKHFGIPVETVRTRLKRALERLRFDLDRDYGGDRGAWCAVLLPFAKAAPAGTLAAAAASLGGVVTALSAGVLVMSVKAKVAAAAAVVASAALAWVFLHSRGEPEDAQRRAAQAAVSPALAAPASVDPAATTPPAAAPADGAARRPEATPTPIEAAPRLGSIHVKVVWEKDHSPAANEGVTGLVSGRRDLYAFTLSAVTDAAGECLLTDAEPGLVLVHADLAGFSHGVRVTVLPGGTAQATLTIPAGVDVEGVVVDEQKRPVAGASIWLGPDGGNSSGGGIVATSDEKGRFAVRSIGGYRFIGARAAGYGPSPFQSVGGQVGATTHVELTLCASGGALAGRVVDPAGKPLPHARVLFGDEKTHVYPPAEQGGMPYHMVLSSETDEDGAFEFESAMVGTLPLAIRARGFAPWRQPVTVSAGAQTDVEVHLERGATLQGKVVDAAGAAVKGAEVAVGAPGNVCSTSVHSAADGSFRLDHLAPGDFEASAELDGRGSVKATLHAASDETVAWNPVLKGGQELRGRVVDEDEHGLVGFHVLAEGSAPESASGWFSSWGESGADGRFSIAGCPPSVLQIRVMFPREGAADATNILHAKAGGEELVIRIPSERKASVWIEGVVADAEGHPPANVNVSVFEVGSGIAPIDYPDHATGRFKVGPYPPGDFRLVVRAEGYPETEFVLGRLAADQTKNVGTLEVKHGGTLRALVRTESGAKVEGFTASCSAVETGRFSEVRFDGTAATTSELAPGRYRLRLEAAGYAPTIELVTIRPGEPTSLEVTLVAAALITLHAPLSEEWKRSAAAKGATPLARVDDSRGEAIASTTWSVEASRLEWTLGLAPGAYSLVLLDRVTVLATANFEVTEAHRPDATLDVELR